MRKTDLLRTALFTKAAADLIPDEVRGDEPSFRAEVSADGSTVEVDIYDLVWPWEAKRMKAAIPPDAKRVHLRVNSPGGDMFAGVAIHNLLKNHPAHVTAEVDGVAASAASLAVMGADRIRMNRGSYLMIHEPWVVAVGGADELRKTAGVLDKFTKDFVALYADRSGLSEKELAKMLAEETWLSGEEAVEKGLADESADTPAASARADLSVYAHAPESLRGTPADPETERELERLAREFGVSHSQARRLTAVAKKIFAPREEAPKATGTPRDEANEGADTADLESFQAALFNARLGLRPHLVRS